jgi:ATP-binding cassette subfamily B protein
MAFETYMELFMTVINYVYLFLMLVIILLARGAGDYGAFALAAVFYLVFSVSMPFTKLMYVSQTGRQIADGIERMDSVLDTPPLSETSSPKTTDRYSVSFENMRFTYNDENEAVALRNVSFTAEQSKVTGERHILAKLGVSGQVQEYLEGNQGLYPGHG